VGVVIKGAGRALVGNGVGVAIAVIGKVVGWAVVGNWVGLAVVGKGVGSAVEGANVGLFVMGLEVGLAVVDSGVGRLVGFAVVGSGVGNRVGTFEGRIVGLATGESVEVTSIVNWIECCVRDASPLGTAAAAEVPPFIFSIWAANATQSTVVASLLVVALLPETPRRSKSAAGDNAIGDIAAQRPRRRRLRAFEEEEEARRLSMVCFTGYIIWCDQRRKRVSDRTWCVDAAFVTQRSGRPLTDFNRRALKRWSGTDVRPIRERKEFTTSLRARCWKLLCRNQSTLSLLAMESIFQETHYSLLLERCSAGIYRLFLYWRWNALYCTVA
jgi:hypothetical protein